MATTAFILLATPAAFNLIGAPTTSNFQVDALTERIVLTASAAALSSAVQPNSPTNFVITGSIQWLPPS